MIPIAWGTLNIAEIRSGTSSSRVPILKVHVDCFDLYLGFAVLHIGGDEGFGGGEFQADLINDAEVDEFKKEARFEARASRFGEPTRVGVGYVPKDYAVAIDLTTRPHTAGPAFCNGARKVCLRHSVIFQVRHAQPAVPR